MMLKALFVITFSALLATAASAQTEQRTVRLISYATPVLLIEVAWRDVSTPSEKAVSGCETSVLEAHVEIAADPDNGSALWLGTEVTECDLPFPFKKGFNDQDVRRLERKFEHVTQTLLEGQLGTVEILTAVKQALYN